MYFHDIHLMRLPYYYKTWLIYFFLCKTFAKPSLNLCKSEKYGIIYFQKPFRFNNTIIDLRAQKLRDKRRD